jgi:hypothetical protein
MIEKGKRVERKGLKVLGEAETEVDVPVRRPAPVTVRGPQPHRLGVPRAAAERPERLCFGIILAYTNRLFAIIGVGIGRAGPFPDITGHMMKPPGIGRQAVNRQRLLPVDPGLGPASVVVVVSVIVGLIGGDAVAGPERRVSLATSGIFPLGFGGQSIGLVGLPTQPGDISTSS